MDGHRTLAGRYELLAVIGRGGMGTVYRARDLILERVVAVKVLPAALADGDPVGVQRFEREARAAASLAHPRIVAVYDTGLDEGTRFIVMEFLLGRSIEAILREGGPLEPARSIDIATGVAEALGAAHTRGIVHRDIKPGNVMIADDGSAKVLDFGVARAVDRTALTHSASVLGTAAYMAPEQVLGHPVDGRSDIYSLGCVLYAMLAGSPPFRGDAVAAILHQQVNVEARPLRAIDARIPAGLELLVMDMLAKDPGARPQSAAQLRERLAQARSGAANGRGGAARAREATPPPPDAPPTRKLVRARGDTRRRLLAVGVLAALALLAAGVAALSSGSAPRAAPPSRKRAVASTSKPPPKTSSTTTSSTSTHTAATAPANTSGAGSATPTVAGSAGALTTLLTTDVEAHSIEQPAAQHIGNEVAAILNSYEMGQILKLPNELANLAQQLEMLESHGQVSASAAPALQAALATFASAVRKSAPEAQAQEPPPAGPPGPQPGNDKHAAKRPKGAHPHPHDH